MWKSLIHRFLNSNGYELVQYPIKKLFDQQNYNVVFDVGANTGQFAREIRSGLGFKGKIVSFEPLPHAFRQLGELAQSDSNWEIVNCALGASKGNAEIHVSNNSVSSSLLEILPKHTQSAPESAIKKTETIRLEVFDNIFNQYCKATDRVFMKIDTQGYELEVLKGANKCIEHIDAIQVELNLCQLYQDAPLVEDVISHIRKSGFEPYWFSPGFRDPVTSQLFQMDGFFVKDNS